MEQVTWRKRGANMAVMMDGERLAKKVTAEETAKIKILVETVNRSIERKHKQTTIDRHKKKILDIMKKKSIEKKKKEEKDLAIARAKERNAKKRTQKTVTEDFSLLKALKSKSKDSLTEEEATKMRELLAEHDKVNRKPSQVSSKSGSTSRESYASKK